MTDVNRRLVTRGVVVVVKKDDVVGRVTDVGSRKKMKTSGREDLNRQTIDTR